MKFTSDDVMVQTRFTIS